MIKHTNLEESIYQQVCWSFQTKVALIYKSVIILNFKTTIINIIEFINKLSNKHLTKTNLTHFNFNNLFNNLGFKKVKLNKNLKLV